MVPGRLFGPFHYRNVWFNKNRAVRVLLILSLVFIFFGIQQESPYSGTLPQCFKNLGSDDSLLIADPDGLVIFKHNVTVKRIPASTLKLLTSLAAIQNLGLEYRFKTEFYIDGEKNMIIKGYGDPLLISEIWEQMAVELSEKISSVNNLLVDSFYFEDNIIIPGRMHSTNPYDAPVGALCANFNTIFFKRDGNGKFISAEPQTPLIPFALDRIKLLGMDEGRYTFSHDHGDSARYAGELLFHFLQKKGVEIDGKVLVGLVKEGDRLIHTYHSPFTLRELLGKLLEYSNNFIANQLVIALGAEKRGRPGTLEKGVSILRDYAGKTLGLKTIKIVEGSGISRENRISALDMLAVLKGFRPYRDLLKRDGPFLFKTGSLRGISTRAGFYEQAKGQPYYFAFFINHKGPHMNSLERCIEHVVQRGD